MAGEKSSAILKGVNMETFFLKFTTPYGDSIVPGIVSSSLISQYNWNNNNISSSESDLITTLRFIDDIVGTDKWQVAVPMFNGVSETEREQIKKVYPLSKFLDITLPIQNPPISFLGEVVPNYGLYEALSSGFDNTITFNNSRDSGFSAGGLTFPFVETGSEIKRSIVSFIVQFPVCPDGFISQGSMNFDVFTEEMYCLALQFFNSRNTWRATVYFRGYSNFSNNNFFSGKEPNNIYSDVPYESGGVSGEGGGGGDFDNTSTPIEIPNLPSISAASTGFISLFNPSLTQLNDLASYLWSDLFEIDGWKKLFADPMDAILGLSILPVAIPSGGTREVKVGNIGTGISLTVASSQFVEVDCGSINVNEYWGAYLDYEPYTQAQIFLPYIGTRPISVDEIMGKTVRVVYHVDILTGACCCFVKCGESVLYTYNGQCSIPIPITGANYTSVVNGVISVAASVGSLVATGGASAPTAVPAIASSVVNQMKPQIEKSGSISGSAGVLNMQTPYLILIRPRQALPSKQNEFIGYPSLITVQLTELTGYTEVQSIHLENIPATQEELAEIQSLLEGGVIF